MVVDEFFLVSDSKIFDKLSPFLKEIEELSQIEFGVSININSYVNSDNEWINEVCDEYLLILHLDEDLIEGISIGC